MLIDTHCHLDAAEFSTDRMAVVERARAFGVEALVVPAIAERTFVDTCKMRDEFGAWPAFGLHPMYLGEHQDAHLASLRRYLEVERPVAVGEIGLDFFVPDLDPVRQMEFFIAQLKLARDFDLPVLLHIRRAQDQVLKALRQVGVRGGIAHAFNGSRQQADAFIRLGFKLGFGGAMTYPRALNIRKLAKELPLESIVLETDAPDIPPEWLGHGGRNEPGELARIAVVLAELRGMSPERIAVITGANARDVLRIPRQLLPISGT